MTTDPVESRSDGSGTVDTESAPPKTAGTTAATAKAVGAASRFEPSYLQVAEFRPQAFTATPFGRGAHLQAMIVCFEPGQFIPVHAPGLDLALVVLEGEGELAMDDGAVTLEPGSIAFIPAGHTRGVKASVRLTAFQVVSPPPTAADHGGVREGLEKGSWR